MFKLIKILNSGRNVPEPMKIHKNTGINLPAGTPFSTDSGIAIYSDAYVAPRYISFADSPADEDLVVCYEVSPDMLFEAEIHGTPSEAFPGDCLGYQVVGGIPSGVSTEDRNDHIIAVNLNGAVNSGDKVIVKFVS